jgi:type IV pilus assembly protein PilA
MLTMRHRSAFTLGELGAVLAATGVVTALAYSAYRTYAVRSEVSEGVVLASDLIPTVTELFRRHGEVPATVDPAPARERSPFVESLSVVDGRIDVVYGGQADPAIAGRRISLTPYETVDRHVVWICGNEIPGPGLEPLGFADGGRRAAQIPTTIETRYLSEPCR